MTLHYSDDWLTVYLGDCRAEMAQLPAESVHCVVTSPPYWGLRDYGIGELGLGLEPTPEAYVEAMVGVFREVKRVLRSDGTLWLNIGDSYNGQGARSPNIKDNGDLSYRAGGPAINVSGLKPKDLVGIPWRLAFALQADGWYLRSDIIWAKPNPMPESVTDRPTKAHEYVFLLSKQPRYFFDADAVREPAEYGRSIPRDGIAPQDHKLLGNDGGFRGGSRTSSGEGGRNLRTVWNIATQPYPGAHFATFPEALVEPCIKAGTSERGVCPECGAPYSGAVPGLGGPIPATVLDPFAGSGTVGRVANRLSRRAILIDLSAEYLDQAMLRNHQSPLGLGA